MSPASLDALEREIIAYEALLAAVHALPHARHAGDDVAAVEQAQLALDDWRAAS